MGSKVWQQGDAARACRGSMPTMWLEEAVQETETRYWQRMQSEDAQAIEHPLAYLLTVAKHVCCDILRSYKRVKYVDNDEDFKDDQDYIETVSSKNDMARQYHLFSALAPKTSAWRRRRKVLRCLMEDVRETSKIATQLHISEPLVSKDKQCIRAFILKAQECYGLLIAHLSERQKRILHCAMDGLRGYEIAQRLTISAALVTQELKRIRKVLAKVDQGPGDDDGGNGGGRAMTKPAQQTNGRSRIPPGRPPADQSPFLAKLLALVDCEESDNGEEEVLAFSPRSADISPQGVARSLLQLPALRDVERRSAEAISATPPDDDGDLRLQNMRRGIPVESAIGEGFKDQGQDLDCPVLYPVGGCSLAGLVDKLAQRRYVEVREALGEKEPRPVLDTRLPIGKAALIVTASGVVRPALADSLTEILTPGLDTISLSLCSSMSIGRGAVRDVSAGEGSGESLKHDPMLVLVPVGSLPQGAFLYNQKWIHSGVLYGERPAKGVTKLPTDRPSCLQTAEMDGLELSIDAFTAAEGELTRSASQETDALRALQDGGRCGATIAERHTDRGPNLPPALVIFQEKHSLGDTTTSVLTEASVGRHGESRHGTVLVSAATPGEPLQFAVVDNRARAPIRALQEQTPENLR